MRAILFAVLLAAPPALGAPASAAAPATPKPQAQPKPSTAPAKPPSERARALSRALVPKPSWERLLDRSAEGLSEAVSRSLAAKGEKVPTDLHATIRKELGKDLTYTDAVDAQAQALEKRFSGDEMQKATTFYESPLGKKMIDQLPEAQGEVGDKLQERLATVVPEILQRVAPNAIGGRDAEPGSPDGGGTGAGPMDDGGTPEAEPVPSPPPAKKL